MGAIGERAAVIRLMRRSGFHAGPDAVAAAVAAGFAATLDGVLAAGPDAGAAGTPPPSFTATRVRRSAGAAARAAARRDAQQEGRRLVLWWLDRMVAADRPWVEKRTLLWHGHWATSIQKVKLAAAMLAQNQTLRSLGGDGFDAVYSEFGRRVAGNANQGTDHGTAGPVFVAGPAVRGGCYGDEPSLSRLDDGDLFATTDFRDVYGTLLSRVLDTDPARVLTGYRPRDLAFV